MIPKFSVGDSSRAEKLALIAEVKKASASPGVIAPPFTPKPKALLRYTNFGASIFRPGRFCVTGISRHFESEADGLNAIAVHAL